MSLRKYIKRFFLKVVKSFFISGIFCIVFGQPILAQSSLDIFTASGRFGFPQQAGEPVRATNLEYGALLNLKIPVILSKKTIWYNDFTYMYSFVQSEAKLGSGIANP